MRGIQADGLLDHLFATFNIGTRQVNLVDKRNNLQTVVDSDVGVGQSLHLHALGGNEQAARLSGIRTDWLKWLAYCIGAVLSSVAGILYMSYESGADPEKLGQGYDLFAIAAARRNFVIALPRNARVADVVGIVFLAPAMRGCMRRWVGEGRAGPDDER